MNNRPIYPQNLKKSIRLMHVLFLALLLSACSQGLRLKNLVNYPLSLSSLDALDTLKISPEFVKYAGTEVVTFRNFNRDIHIQGRPEIRPMWMGDVRGCLQVDQDAKVYIADFNFQMTHADTALIRVSSGHLILENCDFISSDFWAIEVDSGAFLELRNVKFSALGAGAIKLNGGIVKMMDTHFDHISKTAVYASSGDLLEIHNSTFRNTMGSALEINSVNEVWLDSVLIIDSFQDGMTINDCDYVLINQVESRENGRHGLNLNDASICGILNFSALGNLVDGIQMDDVDTLRMVNSEFIGNGQSGGVITNTQRSRIAGIRVGHNEGDGLQFTRGQELWINRSSFQANLLAGLSIDSLKSIELGQLSLVNNGHGVLVTHFDSLAIHNGLMSSNRNNAAELKNGDYVSISKNLIKGNRLGLVISDLLFTNLDSNRVESNKLGNDIRSISNLSMNDNVWVSNESGAYFSEIASMSSDQDQWLSNLDTGLEVFSVKELLISDARIHNNRNGARLNEVSARMESVSIDSSRDAGLKLMNGSLVIHKLRAQHNGTAIELGEGTQAKVTQSHFGSNELTINAEASVSLTLSFSKMTDSRKGIRLGNYAEASILSNQFDLIDGYCVELSGPHIHSLMLRQNVISQTGGILNSQSVSGDIRVRSNTFARNMGGIRASKRTMSRLDHNIFYRTDMIDPQIMRDENLYRWNCIFPQIAAQPSDSTEALNINIDPDFGANYYLNPNSPCLSGGDNGFLIGALGGVPEARPSLQP